MPSATTANSYVWQIPNTTIGSACKQHMVADLFPCKEMGGGDGLNFSSSVGLM